MSQILEATAKGEVDRRLETMTSIIVSYAVERFGLSDSKNPKTKYILNRRATQIHKLRQELRGLKKQYKVAGEEEKQPSLSFVTS